MICWTLGITEHHNAVDNVLALINLALLTGHVGRYGCGLQPAARPEQRAGRRRHGRDPEPAARASRTSSDDARRAAKFEHAVGRDDPAASTGWHLTQMFDAMEHGELTRSTSSARTRRSPTPTAPRQQAARRPRPPRRAGHLPHEPREMADVVLPAAAQLVRGGGHGHEQRAARAARAQGGRAARAGARRHLDPRRPRRASGPRLGAARSPRRSGTRCARSRRSTRRHELRAARGARRASSGRAPTRTIRARRSCTAPVGGRPVEGPRAPFHVVEHDPPVETLDDEFPLAPHDRPAARSPTTPACRPGGYASPLRRGES